MDDSFYIQNSTNESAIKLFQLYKKFNISNYKFILSLYDIDLMNVDPLDEKNLDSETKAKIILEMLKNPWYYFREIVRIPAGSTVKMEFHRGNVPIIWLLLNSINTLIMLPRQRYKTTTILCVIQYLFYFKNTMSTSLLLGNNDALLKKNIKTIRDITYLLPSYIKDYIVKDKMNKDNANEIYYKLLNNVIRKRAPSKSKSGADSVGRGESAQIMFIDEIGHIMHIKEIYEAAAPAHEVVAKKARENGGYHFKVCATTAPYLNKEEGKWTYGLFGNSCEFNEKMFDMNRSQLLQYILKNSNNGFIKVVYSYLDTGVGPSYFKEQCVALNNDMSAIKREVLNQVLDATKSHPLGEEIMTGLIDKIKTPVKTISINNIFLLNIYIENLDFKKKYIMGFDPAGNLSGDFSALVIVDPRNGSIVATMRCNSITTALFGNIVGRLMSVWFVNSILFCEINGIGIAYMDNILHYYPRIKNRVYHRDSKKGEKLPGFYSTSDSRTLMYKDLLSFVVSNFSDKIFDTNIINEISTLIVTRNGKVDHPQGLHDDMVFAMLLAFYFLKYNIPNKSKYITNAEIFSENRKLLDNSNKIIDEYSILTKHNEKMDKLLNKSKTVLDYGVNKVDTGINIEVKTLLKNEKP